MIRNTILVDIRKALAELECDIEESVSILHAVREKSDDHYEDIDAAIAILEGVSRGE